MRISPINKAEAIIAPLFDANLADLKSFSVESLDGLPVAISQSWDSSTIAGGSRNFVLRWKGRFEFQSYDRLRLFINYPPAFTLSATALLNGRSVSLFKDIPGEMLPSEPTSDIIGSPWDYHVLTGLDFHFQGTPGQETHIAFNWIGLVSSVREPDIERELPRYSPEWPGLLNPRGRAGIVEPLFGTRKFLEELPALARQGRFAPLMRGLRQAAARYEGCSPEPDIREYMPCDKHLYRYVRVRDRNRPRWDHPQRMQILALAGYLDGNPAWSRLAARHVLAFAHTPYWFEGPQANCPGSDWHHICFMESHAMGAICDVMPYLGDWLTPAARAKVLDRIEEAWALVNAKCEEPGYRWHMNQGVVNNGLRLVGAAFLYYAGRGERYASAVEQSYRDHTTVVNNYLAGDGHCSEGGYYTYSFYFSIPMWLAYSAYSGRELSSVVPDRFKRSVAFVEATTSTVSDEGAMIPASAGTKPWSGMLLAFLYTACGWQGAANWLRKRLEREDPEIAADEAFSLLTLVPEKLPGPPLPSSGVQGCRQSGLVAYQFPRPHRGKLLIQAERPASGHYHHDRGGVVLEYAGEVLLPDPGSLHYADLRSALMHRADWHNLAHPVGLEMRLADRFWAEKPPAARIERAEETEGGFEFAVDLAPIYGAEVLCGRREGTLRLQETGGTLSLRDNWKFAGARRLEITFNAYAPWTMVGPGVAETRVGKIALRLSIKEAGGAQLDAAVLDDRVDGLGRQIWTLRWQTVELSAADLDSTLSWS